MITFSIITLGCKVNIFESEAYRNNMLSLGYKEVDNNEVADIYIINTCAVTNNASSKSRQRITHAKKINPKAFIAVIGCYAQMQGDKLVDKYNIDLLVGTTNKNEFVNMIHRLYKNRSQELHVDSLKDINAFEAVNVKMFNHHTRAFLKIQDGCNQYCSYCIIPYVRGNERYIAIDKAIANAKELVKNNHKEIVLAGIHTGRYGFGSNINLAILLQQLCEIEGLERIRISSIEINEISDELIDVIKANKKIARHLHIPIQSASNKMLKLMNRTYTVEEYMERIDYIRGRLDNVAISTDIIVGFPQESENDFEETTRNVSKLQFAFAHIFPYSKRDGTKAALMSGHLDNQIKKNRAKELSLIVENSKMSYMNYFITKEVDVLIESNKDSNSVGYTSEYIKVEVQDMFKVGDLVRVNVIDRVGNVLIANA